MNEEQTVDGTDDQVAPETEENGAQDGLEQALAEFDSEVAKDGSDSTQSEQKTDPDLSTIAKKLEDWERREAQQSFRKDMDETVAAIRGDIDSSFMEDWELESWVDGMARNDPRISAAWAQRNTNPKKWQAVQKELSNKLQKKFADLPDRNATEDREAVAAAVRGQSNRTPDSEPEPDFKGKSNADFRDEVYKKYGYRPQT